MRTVGGRLTLTPREAYAALVLADRRGDFKSALTLSNLLIRGFQSGKGVKGFPEDRIPLVLAFEGKARRQYTEHHDATKHDTTQGHDTMPKVSEMNPSKYLKADDCADEDGDPVDLVLTMKAVEREEIGQDQNKQDKWVLYFKEHPKGLVLNVTNTKAIAKLHGDDTDDWIGKRIALYQTEVEFKGETTMGIRVRLKAPPSRGKKAVAVAAAEDAAPAGDDEDCPF